MAHGIPWISDSQRHVSATLRSGVFTQSWASLVIAGNCGIAAAGPQLDIVELDWDSFFTRTVRDRCQWPISTGLYGSPL